MSQVQVLTIKRVYNSILFDYQCGRDIDRSRSSEIGTWTARRGLERPQHRLPRTFVLAFGDLLR
jgi:hypothetical protein